VLFRLFPSSISEQSIVRGGAPAGHGVLACGQLDARRVATGSSGTEWHARRGPGRAAVRRRGARVEVGRRGRLWDGVGPDGAVDAVAARHPGLQHGGSGAVHDADRGEGVLSRVVRRSRRGTATGAGRRRRRLGTATAEEEEEGCGGGVAHSCGTEGRGPARRGSRTRARRGKMEPRVGDS
jgi:hypothetical protein